MIDYITMALLFLNCWAFYRIGNLQTKIETLHHITDKEFSEVWKAYSNIVKPHTEAKNGRPKN